MYVSYLHCGWCCSFKLNCGMCCLFLLNTKQSSSRLTLFLIGLFLLFFLFPLLFFFFDLWSPWSEQNNNNKTTTTTTKNKTKKVRQPPSCLVHALSFPLLASEQLLPWLHGVGLWLREALPRPPKFLLSSDVHDL